MIMKYKVPYAIVDIPLDRRKIIEVCKKTGHRVRYYDQTNFQTFENFSIMLMNEHYPGFKEYGFGLIIREKVIEFVNNTNIWTNKNDYNIIVTYSEFMGVSDIFVKKPTRDFRR